MVTICLLWLVFAILTFILDTSYDKISFSSKEIIRLGIVLIIENIVVILTGIILLVVLIICQ